ncbi:hypothetical protein FUT69_10650 [Xylella taiwanensis]|uniref:Uncharacterized protein n=1 Tax=Xylella taiwanensis TaxID=1444770 RepID=Z9JH51_9GAMM|nr:hypothetical protein [Xylella taiwanensis]AXI82594.1 hypothetical protein AB672_00670 [Xylella taiwanensis]EWS77348.1 hypothetical protein AF72_11310 [Xylella taiwanensis]MCD8455588.1 hypothetical protein [Xylella taiwanensis]MCD8457995.1 hypothetical protein [Xylella taiwanensis]MCD8460130.1 hypothetical protein [Xylella taiwanensis]
MYTNKHHIYWSTVLCVAVTGWPQLGNTQTSKSNAKKLYCWHQNGQRICSDTLPAEAVNAAHEEFSANNGIRKNEVQRAPNANERAAIASEEAQRLADQTAQETRKRADQIMLTAFQTEDDLRQVFLKRIATIDNNVTTARYNATNLRQGLVNLLRSANERELAGQKVPDTLAANIQQRRQDLLSQKRLQTNFEQERAALNGEIEETLQRYRALKSGDINASLLAEPDP